MNPQSQNITLGSHTLCPNCADDIQFFVLIVERPGTGDFFSAEWLRLRLILHPNLTRWRQVHMQGL